MQGTVYGGTEMGFKERNYNRAKVSHEGTKAPRHQDTKTPNIQVYVPANINISRLSRTIFNL